MFFTLPVWFLLKIFCILCFFSHLLENKKLPSSQLGPFHCWRKFSRNSFAVGSMTLENSVFCRALALHPVLPDCLVVVVEVSCYSFARLSRSTVFVVLARATHRSGAKAKDNKYFNSFWIQIDGACLLSLKAFFFLALLCAASVSRNLKFFSKKKLVVPTFFLLVDSLCGPCVVCLSSAHSQRSRRRGARDDDWVGYKFW